MLLETTEPELAPTTQILPSVSIAAAGATFPMPFYNMAFKQYTDKTGISVSYGGIGSGGGIRSLKDKVVDFGASDAFLSDDKMAEMPAPDPVHQDAGRERMFGIHQPARQFQSSALLFIESRTGLGISHHLRDAPRHQMSKGEMTAAEVNRKLLQ